LEGLGEGLDFGGCFVGFGVVMTVAGVYCRVFWMMLLGSSGRFALAISKDTRSWVSLKLHGRFWQERGRPSYELVPENEEPTANQDGSSRRSPEEQTKFADYVRAGTVTAV
jgi:hypothetical protein